MKKVDSNENLKSDNFLKYSDGEKIFLRILERLPNGIGRDYLNGKVTTSHDDVFHLVFSELQKLPISNPEFLSAYKEFTLYQITQQVAGSFDKPMKDVVIPIPMEKNLLRNMNYASADYARNTLRKLVKNLCQREELTSIEALGLLLGNLMLESGVITKNDQIAVLRSIPKGLRAIENVWFLDTINQFTNSTKVGVKRHILDPLSIFIFMKNFEDIRSLISDNASDKELASLIRKAFNALYCHINNECLSVGEFRRGATLEALIRLPGFIYQRVLSKSESYDLPLHAFARSMDVYVAPLASDKTSDPLEDEDEEYDEETDDTFEDTDLKSKKSRAVKANFITKPQFDKFLGWIKNHPSISVTERSQLELLYSLAFCCGLRRGEVKALRLIDITPEIPTLAHVRPYVGLRLKTLSSNRKVFLHWLPNPLCQAICHLAKDNRHSEKTLIEAYSGSPFISSLFDRANNFLFCYFGDSSLTVHSLRHSFASLNLIKLMAGSLRMFELFGLSSLVDDVLTEASSFTHLLVGHLNPSAKLLWTLSKAFGHSDPTTTLRSYTHVLDILSFYSYAYSRPSGYYTRICEISGTNNRQLHKVLSNPKLDSENFYYDESISFSGKMPFSLLRKFETNYPDSVIRFKSPLTEENPYTNKTWSDLTALFNAARTHPMPIGISNIFDESTILFIQTFIPSNNEINALLSLQKIFPQNFIRSPLLTALCSSYDRRQGHLFIRHGFPVKELANLLRRNALCSNDFILKSYGDSVINKKLIPLKSNFSALSRLKINGQLSFRPKHLRRVPHSAIHWYFCAIFLQRSQMEPGIRSI